MYKSVVASHSNHEVVLIEFYNRKGITITSFFQVISLPNKILGAFDYLDEALQLMNFSIKFGSTTPEEPLTVFFKHAEKSSANDCGFEIN